MPPVFLFSLGRYLLGLGVIGFWLYSNLSDPFKKLVLARADLRISLLSG